MLRIPIVLTPTHEEGYGWGPLYRWESWGLRSWSDLPNVRQLTRCGSRTQARCPDPRAGLTAIMLPICFLLFGHCVYVLSHSVMSDSLWSTGCSPPGSSVHEILQARILEWVVVSSSRGSSWPRDWTCVSWVTGGFFTTEPPREPQFAP